MGGRTQMLGKIGGLLAKPFTNWHGSQHLFKAEPGAPYGRFDLGRKHTGEGNATFGEGAYSGDAREVGQRYKETLGRMNPALEHPEIGVVGPSQAKEYLATYGQRTMPGLPDLKAKQMAHDLVHAQQMEYSQGIRDMMLSPEYYGPKGYGTMADEARRFAVTPNPGHLYELRINADPDVDFLHQNRAVSGQSDKVQAALKRLGVNTVDAFSRMKAEAEDILQIVKREGGGQEMAPAMNKVHNAKTYAELHDAFFDTEQAAWNSSGPVQNAWSELRSKLFKRRSNMDIGGFEAYSSLAQRMGKDQASQALREEGLAGMRFLDQGSRPATAYMPKNPNEGKTFNTITFDDRLITVVARYGIAGAVASGLITREVGDQMRAAGYSDKPQKGAANGT